MPVERELERRIVTALFADLVGFTSLSERLDAEDVAAVQDAYFSAVREALERYGGRLEKYIGDAVVAIFGIPRARDDDAERAVRAALALASAVERVAAAVGLDEGALRVRVGVNTGEVVYGETEGPERGQVTGDTVNVAARLQSAAPPGSVLVGEGTMLSVAHAIDLEDAGLLDLKGKREPVRAWRAVAAHADASRERAMGSLRAATIGREREVSALLEALARARAGASEWWLIVAPPGVGKSRLIAEVIGRAADAAVLRARCRVEVAAPYDAVGQMVRAALARLRVDANDPEHIVRIVQERGAGAGLSPERARVVADEIVFVLAPAAGDARPVLGDREHRFAAWLEALDALASDATPLWVVEDLHWAGADLVAFVAQARASAPPRGRMIVTTTRRAPLDGTTSFAVDPSCVIELDPLEREHATSLVHALVGGALPRDLVERLAARSDGNPLFIEELLRAWVSVGVLVRDGAAWKLTRDVADVPFPSTVQSIYAAQLDDLPAGARAVARNGSVAGRRFPSEALLALGASDPDGVRTLVARAFISGPHEDVLAGDAYAFRHALLRDAGYASLARGDRARLHVRFARWLEDAAADRLDDAAELIATQYESALAEAPALRASIADGLARPDVAQLASSWLERAAERSWALAAHAASTELFRRSLAHTAEAAVIDRARRLARLGEILAASGDMDDGGAVLAEAAELFHRELPGGGAVARAGYASATAALARVWYQQLRFADAEALADAALSELGDRSDREIAMLLCARATNAVAHRARWPQAEEDVGHALAIARELADTALELDALCAHTTVQGSVTGRIDLATHQRIEELGRAHGRWDVAIGAMRVRAIDLELRGDRAGARALYDSSSDLATARGLVSQVLWCDYARAELAFVAGDWDDALAFARRAIDGGERSANHRVVVRAWFVAVPVAAARGDVTLLRRAFEWHERHRAGFPDSPYARLMVGAMGLLVAGAGIGNADAPAPGRLTRSFDSTVDVPSESDAAITVFDAWLASGLVSAARAAFEPLARASDGEDASPLARGTVALIDARARAREGVGGAEASARRALRHFRSAVAPWWIARALATLDELGAASDEEQRERDGVLDRLGIPRADE